jgi:hypothetical protein
MHCKKEHGQAWKGDTSVLYTRVKVQTFFRAGGLQQYFIVDATDGSSRRQSQKQSQSQLS